jgi:hypothetical protein
LSCTACGVRLGIEADSKEVSSFIHQLVWTDEAQYVLERLPPYVAPLLKGEVEGYAQGKGLNVVTYALVTEAKNHGAVVWNSEAEHRLERVPPAVRAMARVELERTALDRGMAEVTVSLMEEVKSRYFGMGMGK